MPTALQAVASRIITTTTFATYPIDFYSKALFFGETIDFISAPTLVYHVTSYEADTNQFIYVFRFTFAQTFFINIPSLAENEIYETIFFTPLVSITSNSHFTSQVFFVYTCEIFFFTYLVPIASNNHFANTSENSPFVVIQSPHRHRL